MLRVGVEREEAERRIAAAGGRLRGILGDPPAVDRG